MSVIFKPLPTEIVRALQAGGPDAYGDPPERRFSEGTGTPCRHCLKQVAAGKPYLVVAYRPFETLQPYAETGPLFLCAETCEPAAPSGSAPEMLESPNYIVRGYNAEEQIIYGTGAVTPTAEIGAQAESIFADEAVAFVHVRSATNNCYQFRIERA
ncbi:DUF1203 domain-containing protein [Hoeflea sp. WL0058]|uniref:DUF1203 domain-containing protein n=1 Tax=Flavimaribacter sediminis TaxID=2865987 RepID=A0AAE2ZPM9_9HYPH|nr:DUF1203 domain-containing protein [Flavimaribacter sediminis]MBW8638560.1 DUF1203 domain-containing protein [Flavimaribacter sediminis]